MVGVKGLEPSTPWSQTRCATRLRYTPNNLLTDKIYLKKECNYRQKVLLCQEKWNICINIFIFNYISPSLRPLHTPSHSYHLFHKERLFLHCIHNRTLGKHHFL